MARSFKAWQDRTPADPGKYLGFRSVDLGDLCRKMHVMDWWICVSQCAPSMIWWSSCLPVPLWMETALAAPASSIPESLSIKPVIFCIDDQMQDICRSWWLRQRWNLGVQRARRGCCPLRPYQIKLFYACLYMQEHRWGCLDGQWPSQHLYLSLSHNVNFLMSGLMMTTCIVNSSHLFRDIRVSSL